MSITDQDYANALEAGILEAQVEVRARSARYVADRDAIEIVTVDNGGLLIPRRLIGALDDATVEDMAKLIVWPDGSILELEDLDIQVAVHGLVTLALPVLVPRRIIALMFAAQGGAARSAKKAASARKNGKKGGRPRKKAAFAA